MRFLLVLLLAGCSHVRIDSNGTTTTGPNTRLHVERGSFGALVLATLLLAAAANETGSDAFFGTPKPELDPERRVSEQDCTRPIELGGNLKCR